MLQSRTSGKGGSDQVLAAHGEDLIVAHLYCRGPLSNYAPLDLDLLAMAGR